MPLVPGLNPAVRLEDDPAEGAISPMDVTVEQAGDEPDVPEFDQSGAILRIDHGDARVGWIPGLTRTQGNGHHRSQVDLLTGGPTWAD